MLVEKPHHDSSLKAIFSRQIEYLNARLDWTRTRREFEKAKKRRIANAMRDYIQRAIRASDESMKDFAVAIGYSSYRPLKAAIDNGRCKDIYVDAIELRYGHLRVDGAVVGVNPRRDAVIATQSEIVAQMRREYCKRRSENVALGGIRRAE